MKKIILNAEGLGYKFLNDEIHKILKENSDIEEIVINNVYGQRYIAAGIKKNISFILNGTAGNDLGIFMDGAKIFVDGNAQDGVGNTMNSGLIIVDGCCGDVLGYGMRGGNIYIKDNAGYRVGIHMKSYKDNFPVIVIGGSVGDFLGEYMAGGIIIVLGLNTKDFPVGNFVGTGMHGGSIFIMRDNIDNIILGKEVKIDKVSQEEFNFIKKYIDNFCKYFTCSCDIFKDSFIKLYPYSSRPYGRLYAY